MAEATLVAVKPGEGLFRVFRRGSVFHGDELFRDAHLSFMDSSVSPASVQVSRHKHDTEILRFAQEDTYLLSDGMAIIRRITPSRVMLQLSLNII